jgi:hypothetical protein
MYIGNHEDTIERYWKQSILNTENTSTEEFLDCLQWVAELLRKVGAALNDSSSSSTLDADAILDSMMRSYDLHHSDSRVQDGLRLYHTKEILLELSYFDFSVCKPASIVGGGKIKRRVGNTASKDGFSRSLVLSWVEWMAPLWLNSVYGGPDAMRYSGGFTMSQSKSQLVRRHHNRLGGHCGGGGRNRRIRAFRSRV